MTEALSFPGEAPTGQGFESPWARFKMKEEKNKQVLFWADQLAQKIINRKSFYYLNKGVQPFKEFTVKTSASISGVLHIGRLSDTIRGSSVAQALMDAGKKVNFIWVAEDMDPLRSIPEGVPKSYEKYAGMAVTDIPDPDGCHKSYAEHHTESYFKVLDKFVFIKMKRFSMRQEYRSGNFRPFIKKILENLDKNIEIQNRHRTNPLKKGWSPWTPVCSSCGKLATPRISKYEDGIIHYSCEDYQFDKVLAKGCGHKGTANPLKDYGKLMWKSEWASQWARWKVNSEGAGKEYQVPNSAWWINGEICERILDFPMPEPIFYEHLMINGVKMSASLGNVVYPEGWLEVATPQLLKFFYNKRLMKTRSFSWKDLGLLYDDYDAAARVFFGKEKIENKKEEEHLKRLYFMANNQKAVEKIMPVAFSHAVIISQIYKEKKDLIVNLKKTGHYDERVEKEILDRIEKAKKWVTMYAADELKFEVQNEPPQMKLTAEEKTVIREIISELRKKTKEEELARKIYDLCNANKVSPKEFFKAGYKILLNKEKGPRLASFLLILGEKAISLLEQAVNQK